MRNGNIYPRNLSEGNTHSAYRSARNRGRWNQSHVYQLKQAGSLLGEKKMTASEAFKQNKEFIQEFTKSFQAGEGPRLRQWYKKRKEIMTTAEASREFKIPVWRIRRAARNNWLPSKRTNKGYEFSRADFIKCMGECLHYKRVSPKEFLLVVTAAMLPVRTENERFSTKKAADEFHQLVVEALGKAGLIACGNNSEINLNQTEFVI